MPAKPLRPCTHPGCGVLTIQKHCIKHEGQYKEERSGWSRQGSATERGYGYTWQKIRKLVMLRDGGLCQSCLANGIVREATEVDHILPKAKGGTDEDHNLQAICKSCHQDKTALESAHSDKRVSYYPEWLPRPAIPVTVVCGPPGAGKTTYCEQRAGKEDLVIDVDEIAARITGKPIYHASFEELSQAIRVRNKMLADLANTTYKKAWLITVGKYESKRNWWRDKLNAELIVLEPDKRTCIARVKADERRPKDKLQATIDYILNWE